MTTYKARCINGYYESIRTVTVDRRLATMPSAQAGIIDHVDIYDGKRFICHVPGHTLISYDTIAATLTASGTLTISCLCSVSTRKHVSAFLREYCPEISYQDAKAAYNGNYSIDINTGDHIDTDTGEILNPIPEAV